MRNQYTTSTLPFNSSAIWLSLLLGFFGLCSTGSLQAQWNTPTLNGAIGAGEYGTHTDGQNQQAQGTQVWYMTWDNNNLYVGITNTNRAEAAVLYFDVNLLAPINGGTNANGTQVGFNYDNTSFANLPFRADVVLYVKDSYRELRSADGANGWGAPSAGFGAYADNGSNLREFSIPWTAFPGGVRPAQFAWFGYVTTAAGSAFTTMPTANPTGAVGLGARWSRYFKVDNTGNGTSIRPFNRDCYVFNSTTDITGFGALTVWDFTMSSAGRTVSRGAGLGGAWVINGTLLADAGTVGMGLTGTFSPTTIANLTINSGAAFNMDATTQAVVVTGNFFTSGIMNLSTAIGGDLRVGGNFTHSTGGNINATGAQAREVQLNGTAAQTVTALATGTNVAFFRVTNTNASGATLASGTLRAASQFDLNANARFNVSAGEIFEFQGTNTSTLAAGSIMTVNGTFTRTSTGTGTITSTGSMVFGAGAVYNHQCNGANVPTATWNATSTCNITGITTTNPTGLSGAFGNFTWNNAGQTSATGAISAAMTVNGNLSVLAGTLLLPTFGITGNAAGTCTVANGATLQIGNGATAISFPTLFTPANISLGASSTVIYGSTIAQTVLGGISYGNLTAQGASVKTASGLITVNGNLNVNAGTLADGGFQISGNVAGLCQVAAGATLTLGSTTVATAFPTNFTAPNITLNLTSTVIYNSNLAQTISNLPTYGNLSTVATAGVTKTLAGNTTVAGNFSNGANNTTNFNGFVLTLSGTWTNSGTVTINAANSGVNLVGATPITFTIGTYTGTLVSNFTSAKNAGVAVTLGAVITINNLTVSSGTLSDGSFQITGQAAGLLSVANGATFQIGSAATGTAFPSNYVTANVSLATGSTVVYGATSAQVVSVVPSAYHNLTVQGSGNKSALGSLTINGNLAITNATLNDNGFQINGNATGTLTMSASANSILQLGNTTVATVFPTGFTATNISIGSGAIVRYNSNLNQNVSNLPTYSVLQLQSAGGTPVKTLLGNTNVVGPTGMITVGTGNTFNLGGFILNLTGTVGGVSPITNTGTISANTDGGSTIILAGTNSMNIAPGTIAPAARFNLQANTTGGVTQGVSFNVFNFSIGSSVTYTLQASAVLGIAGTYGNSGTLSAANSGSALLFNGSTPQTFLPGTLTGGQIGAGTAGGLRIDNPSGVTLSAALNVATLTLTNGNLNTTGTNVLTVIGTTVASVSGGSATSYVNGPLRITLPTSLSAAATYRWPVGKSAFNMFELINPTTNASPSAVIQVEVFDASTGGAGGAGFTSLNTDNYWRAEAVSNPASLTSAGLVRLTEGGLTAGDAIGNASTLGGTYNFLGGTGISTTITSAVNAPVSLGFFVIGATAPLCGVYTVGSGVGDDFPLLTNAFAALNSLSITCNVVFELTSNYNGAGTESFPLSLNTLNYVGGSWTTTIRPAAGVTARVSSGDPGSGGNLITLNGAVRVTFDGRPGGTGSAREWTIRNTRTTTPIGGTVVFQNEASNNTLRNLILEGGSSTTTNGVVAILSTTGTSGNDFITIQDNIIRSLGTTRPSNAFYSLGNGIAGRENNDITIAGNQISDFTSSGITAGSTGIGANWSITGNSFFCTYAANTQQTAVVLNTPTFGNHLIDGNFVGGTAANCGGTAWTNSNGGVMGIQLNNGTTVSTISNNTVQNFNLTSISSTNFWINLAQGNITATGNTVGHPTTAGSITSNEQTVIGIRIASSGTTTVENNIVANITSTNTTTSATFFGINSSIAGNHTIENNQIYNLSSVSTNTANPRIVGIGPGATASSFQSITRNLIYNLSSSANAAVSLIGIQYSGMNNPVTSTITRNFIHSLNLTGGNVGASAIGIQVNAGASTIANNVVRLGLTLAGASMNNTNGCILSGIEQTHTLAGNLYYHNTVLIDGNATSTANTFAFRRTVATTNLISLRNNILVNTRVNGGAGRNYVLSFNTNTGINSDNNLLWTNNATGAAVGSINNGVTPLATYQAYRVSTLGQEVNTGFGNPNFVSPAANLTLSPGNAASLNVNSPTPAEATGDVTVIASVPNDYTGAARAGFSPADLGAFANNHTPIDVVTPSIVYTPLVNTFSTANYPLISVSITDAGSGVPTSGGNVPRIWYRRSGPTAGTWVSTPGVWNGSTWDFEIDYSLGGNSVVPNVSTIYQYYVVAQDNAGNVWYNDVEATAPIHSNVNTQITAPTTPRTYQVLPQFSGTVTVGTGGNFTSFTRADGFFAAMNSGQMVGNLTVNVISNINIEDGAVALNQWVESPASSNYTLTIQSNGPARIVEGSYNGAAFNTNGLFRFNGADRVKINGGTGTQRLLTFRNNQTLTTTFSAAVSLFNDADDMRINNCNLQATTGSGSNNGVVYIGGVGTAGNDRDSLISNTISDIGNGTNFPNAAIVSAGISSSLNTNLLIDGNNIANVYTNGGVHYGVRIETFNSVVSITNNSFYQTATRNPTLSGTEAYYIFTNTNSGVVTITGNQIGGNAPALSGLMQYSPAPTAPANFRFVGIWQNTAIAAGNTITGNTINRIVMQTASGANTNYGAFSGIYILGGNATIDNNQIGSNTVDALTASTLNLGSNSNGAAFFGIRNIGSGTLQVTNNNIGGILVSNATSSGVNTGAILMGISTTAGSSNITGNLIGSATQANNFAISGLNATTNPVTLYGIQATTAAGTVVTINNNTVRNLVHGGLTSNGVTFGILATSGAQYTINNNTVANIRSAGTQSTTGTGAVMGGIGLVTANTQALSVSGNTIFDLNSNGSSSSGAVIGIVYNGGTSASNSINGNIIHSFNHLAPGSAAQQIGIELPAGAGVATVSNNMIRLGRNAAGANVNVNLTMTGMLDASTSAHNIWHNTVLVDGTAPIVGSPASTFAYRRIVTSGADNVRNNIFANNRTGGATGSIHLAWSTNTTGGFTATSLDNNLFFSAGNTEFSINNGSTNLSGVPSAALRMQAMRAQAPVGNNLRSGIASLALINFINSSGDAASVNLRLNNSNAAAGAASPIATLTSDIDANTRSTTAPAIGAHESPGFVPLNVTYDVYTPNFSFTAVPNAFPCGPDITVNLDATITDIGTGLSGAPALWWRRSAPTATAWTSVNGTLSSGTINDGLWNFTFTTPGALGETYQYYIVAQDQATTPNLWFSSFDASTPVHSSPTVQVTPPTAPTSFTTPLLPPLSGTVSVGTSGTYPRFNGAGGLFEAINTRGLSGNLDVIVTSNVSELANWTPLNTFTEYCGSGYTVTIRPAAATVYTIETNASAANPMFSFYGVQRLFIDGRFGGSGRFLLLRHNRITPSTLLQPTVEYNNGSRNCSIRNCIIEGGNTSLNTNTAGEAGTLMIGGAMGFGSGLMRDITVEENLFRNNSNVGSPTLAHIPQYHIWMGGNSNNCTIRNITIRNNELTNFQTSAISASNGGTSVNSIGDSLTITGNRIYQGLNIGTYQYPIVLDAFGFTRGHVISNNQIGGSANPNPNITGTWTNPLVDGEIVGIYVNTDDAPTQAEATQIIGNTISNITLSGTGYGNFIGIRVENGRVSVRKNTIGSLASSLTSPNIIMDGNGDLFDLNANSMMAGIWTQSTEEVVIDSNIVCGLTNRGGLSFFDGIAHGSNLYFNYIPYQIPGGKATITNNQILFNRSGSRLQSLILSSEAMMGIFCWTNAQDNLLENNIIANCGSGTSIWNRNVRIHGMFVGVYGSTTAQTGIVRNNRISYLFNENTGDNTGTINPIVYGLSIANGNWTVANNTIFLNNGTQGGTIITNTNTSIRGINDGMLFNQANCAARYYNNTVMVSGSNSTGAGPANSTAAFLRFPLDWGSISITAGAPIELRNNIFINNRSGLGNHRPIWNNANTNANAAINWNASTSNYNFLASPNAANLALWGASANLDLTGWRTISGGDNSSWSVPTTTGASSNIAVNPTELFLNASGTGVANLRINPANTASWFANGKGVAGIQVQGLGTDLDGDTRETTFGFGMDIGADEFTPTAAPHAIVGAPAPSLGGTTHFDIAGRRIGSVVWGTSGTVPSSITAQYYSGDQAGTSPSPALTTTDYADFYTFFNPTGGSAYSYDAVLHYDDALTGTYTNPALMPLLITDAGSNWVDGIGITSTTLRTITGTLDLNAASYVAPALNPCAFPIVNTPPANVTVCEGQNTSFTVVNSGLAPFTYQWQLSTNGGSSWSNLSNGGVYSGVDATTLNLSAVPFSLNTYQYRVVITNSCGNTTSVAATLTVNQPPQITAYSPPSFVNNVCALSNTGFGVTATGTGLSYQWEISTDGGTSWNNVLNDANYSGATAATMFISNTPASFHEHQYRVIVSGTCPSPITSLVGTLNVGQVTLNTQPPSTTVACAGTVATVTVGATGNDLAYQWQISTNNGVSFSPLSNSGVYSGVDTETLTMTGVTVGMNNYQYRVLIGSVACPTVTSSASVLTVNPLLSTSVSIAAAPGNVICDGTSVTFTASPVNGGTTPTYQWLLNGSPVGINANTYTSASLVNGDVVSVEMTSSATCPIPATSASNQITMTVNPILPASVSISTASTTVCQGSNITFTATPVNGGATPSYAWTVNGISVGTNSATFSTTALANGDVVEVVMTSSETCVSGSPASSNSIAMTVQFVGQWLGFTSDWNTSSNWGCGVLPTITTVVNLDDAPVGGNQPVVSSSLTALVRDLNMAVGSSVNINSGADLSVYGNIDNQGNPSFGSGTIIFAGNDLHTVGGANVLSIGSVVVNNAAPGLDVQLNQSLSISNSLTMTAGTLDLNGFDIDLGTTGELVNETNTNRVLGLGEIKSQRTLAPSTTYANIAGLGVSITTDATAPGVTLIERGHQSQAVSSNNSIRRYYDINPTVNTGLNATLRMAYFDDDLSDIDGIDPSENQLIPWRSTDNGVTWEGQHFPTRITNNAAANWVQLTQIPAFSRWTLSDWLTEPLPVELLNFNATAAGNVVNLSWSTASEINNDYFTVERSKDAQQFEAVLQRDGAGNSNTVLTYNDVDSQPYEGLSYYRLKQTDINGEFSYSEVVPVYFGGISSSTVNAWVNAEGQIVANIRSRFNDNVQLELFDISGRIVYTQNAGLTEGLQQLFIQPGQLSGGVYLLSIRGKHIEHMQKMMLK